MKLRLEGMESATLIIVTEEVRLKDLPVLSVGIQKIIQNQQEKGWKKHIALDLSSIDETSLEPGVQQEILQLRAITSHAGVTLALISPIQGFGDVPGRETAETFLASPTSRFMLIEIRLKTHYQALQEHRAKLTEEIQKERSSKEGDAKAFRKKNDELQIRIKQLETLIHEQLQTRIPPTPLALFSSKMETIQRTATAILEQEGLLQVTSR